MLLLRALVAAIVCCLSGVGSADTASAGEQAEPSIDPRKVFSKNCAWCHNNFGLEAGKGPRLAGTSLSAKQVYERIANGKSGLMPAYKKMLTEGEIRTLTEYIKALPAN